MSDQDLERLAERVGLVARWQDYRGDPKVVAPESLRAILQAMGLPCASSGELAASLARVDEERARPHFPPLLTGIAGEDVVLPDELSGLAGKTVTVQLEGGGEQVLTFGAHAHGARAQAVSEPGYHRAQSDDGEFTLAIAPRQAFSVSDVAPGRRLWGLATQLYSLRRKGAGDGGYGDFTALAETLRCLAGAGADAVAISPVHALYAADSNHYSPYAPSSRLFLNPAYVDPAELVGEARAQAAARAAGVPERLATAPVNDLVDWREAASARLHVLRALFDDLTGAELNAGSSHPWARELRRFRKRSGGALTDHARFEVMHSVQVTTGNWNWRDWPERWRNPRSRAVFEFAREHAADVDFHVFLQWLADRGFAKAQKAGRDAGMLVGLVADLAVGTDGSGSHAWSRQEDILVGLSVGAPPDLLNAAGQSWGLTSFSPRALRQHAFGPFLQTLRAALRHAGGARIDHVLGLQRLWLVPEGASARDGAYLRYPFEDMLRLIALESSRERAIIVGEDLGTVPEGFQDRLAAAGVMGMRVLWFERQHGLFTDPARWSSHAMATTSTHDLPTVAGWWSGRDIDWRSELDRLPPDSGEAVQRSERADDRRTLWAAFEHAGVARGEAPGEQDPAPVIDAAVRFVARSPSPLAIIPVEDIIGLKEQPNLPGTTNEHPNWRRRLPAPVDDLLEEPGAAARLAALREERHGRPVR